MGRYHDFNHSHVAQLCAKGIGTADHPAFAYRRRQHPAFAHIGAGPLQLAWKGPRSDCRCDIFGPMSNALPIDGRDFRNAGGSPEARSELPILGRRRPSWASTRMQELDMPGGSGVDCPGYDGFCRSDEGSAFCPMGGSVWELRSSG